jgi:hypothetical protein
MQIKRKPDEECKSCNYVSKNMLIGVCRMGMDRTPNCPCKKCLVKPTCSINKHKECEKFQMHEQYYLRSPAP